KETSAPPLNPVARWLKRLPEQAPAPRRATRPEPGGDGDEERSASDFLSASPVFAPRASSPEPAPFVSEAAREIAAIAPALEFLGVPVARRRPLSVAMLELARTLDSGGPDWN